MAVNDMFEILMTKSAITYFSLRTLWAHHTLGNASITDADYCLRIISVFLLLTVSDIQHGAPLTPWPDGLVLALTSIRHFPTHRTHPVVLRRLGSENLLFMITIIIFTIVYITLPLLIRFTLNPINAFLLILCLIHVFISDLLSCIHYWRIWAAHQISTRASNEHLGDDRWSTRMKKTIKRNKNK